MELRTLLKLIELKPELYIGNNDIMALRHFLSGYIGASKEVDPNYDDWLFSDFRNHLAQKYRDNRDYDWATLIAAHEADGGTTDAFFRLISEYRSRSNL